MKNMKNSTKRNKKNNKKDKKSSTVKNKPNKPNEQKDIVLKFLSLFVTIKLWHWKTNLYSIHKSTDEFLESFLDHTDRFIEVMLGKKQNRIHLGNINKLRFTEINNSKEFLEVLHRFSKFITSLHLNDRPDLITIRDEIIADLNKLLYLQTFK
jgi:hypothetical protein